MNCSCPPALLLHHTLQSLQAQIRQFLRWCLLNTNRVDTSPHHQVAGNFRVWWFARQGDFAQVSK